MSRWVEFFEGEGNRLSMARLMQFMAWFPATLVLIYDKSEEALGLYLGAFVVNYLGGKFADKMGAKNVVTIESENSGGDSGDAGDSVDTALDKRKLGGKCKGKGAK